MVKHITLADIAPPINGRCYWGGLYRIPPTISRVKTALYFGEIINNTAPKIWYDLIKPNDILNLIVNNVCFRAVHIRLICGAMYIAYKKHLQNGNKYFIGLFNLSGYFHPVFWFEEIHVYKNVKIWDWYETDLDGLKYIIEFINEFYKLTGIYENRNKN